MSRRTAIAPEFVDLIPDRLEDGVLYISIGYGTAAHACCCGCGREVTTPLTRADWRLIFDGESVSLQPSIGNRSFPCQSHYFITMNRIRWVEELVTRANRGGTTAGWTTEGRPAVEQSIRGSAREADRPLAAHLVRAVASFFLGSPRG
jgi:hypothetical protein